MLSEYKRIREDGSANAAKFNNEFLSMMSVTKFKVGDIVMLDGKISVRITEVQPSGWISVPGQFGRRGWIGPIKNDVDVYRYKGVPNSEWTGQTTEDRLS